MFLKQILLMMYKIVPPQLERVCVY